MRKFNADNERTKRRYFDFLTDAKQLSEDTVDQVAAALADFEASTGFRDFRQFRLEQAQSYKRRLATATNAKTGRPLAKATITSRLAALKAFFQWLSMQSGFKSRVSYSEAEYFNPSGTDERIAKGSEEKRVPSLEQIRHVLANMRGETDVERRDKALIAFTLLSGARDNAIASMSLKHVDLERRRIYQYPREGVRTKNAKTIATAFFAVGDDFVAIVSEWVLFLQEERLWGPDDPLFAASKREVGDSGHFENGGLDRRHWKSAAAIRRIFRDAFESAGLPYFNPHSFRSTLAILGELKSRNAEDLKAWSQNLGHANMLTTLMSYGTIPQHRQDAIMLELASFNVPSDSAQQPSIPVANETLGRIEKMIRQMQDELSRRPAGT